MGGKVWLPGGQPRRPSSGRLNGALWSRATEGHWPGGGRFCKVSQQSASESGRPGGGADRGPGWWTERRARPRRVEGPQAREGVPGLQGEPEMHSTGQRGTVGTGGKGGLLRATLVSQNVVHDPPACAPPGGAAGAAGLGLSSGTSHGATSPQCPGPRGQGAPPPHEPTARLRAPVREERGVMGRPSGQRRKRREEWPGGNLRSQGEEGQWWRARGH